MKILQISDLAPPHIGGVEKVVWKYGKLLSEKGNRVSILTSRLQYTKDHEFIENIEYIRVPKYALAFPSLYTNDFDIIHSHSYFSFFGLGLEKKIKGSVIIKHIHSVYENELENFTGWSFSRIFSLFEKTLLKSDCTAIIVPSEFTKNKLIEYGINKKIYVVPHGVEYSNFLSKERAREILEIPKDKKVVGFVGRMSKGKGPQDIAMIWAQVMKKIKDATLVFVGPEPDIKTSGIKGNTDEVKKILKASNSIENVIFAGRVDDDKMPIYFSSFDVFVLPSINEGFGLSILNAMAAGVPVVAYNNSAISEVVNDSGILVPTHDINALRDAIISLLTDKNLYLEYSEKGKMRASKFTWEIAIKKLLNIYSNYV